MHFNSPWLEQLKKRKVATLKRNVTCDVVIVGAGISGVTSAYYLLKDTDKKVVVIDAHLLAHGATGTNAGQIASYFERSFSTLVRSYGMKLAADAQRSVLGAWDLLDHIVHDARIVNRPSSFAGFAACASVEQLLVHLRNMAVRSKQHISMDFAYVLDDPKILKRIPKKYKNFYSTVSRKEIMNKLETNDRQYIAALTVRKGCMNSAKFCEELVDYMKKKYRSRFLLFEKSPATKLILHDNNVILHTENNKIVAEHALLCTNGYGGLQIHDALSKKAFKNTIKGTVGYMAGYLQRTTLPPVAISYLPKGILHSEPYFYLTRRKHSSKTSLICVGGPEKQMGKKESYDMLHSYIPQGKKLIKKFLITTFVNATVPSTFKYEWQGLMGYTSNGIRWVGFDPRNKRLLYNLGCNGVGILPAIYGSKRISLLMQGKKLSTSIFDPSFVLKK